MQAHLANQTQYTRTGKLNMANRKPFRNKAQKTAAHSVAKIMPTGQYRAITVRSKPK